MVRRLEGLLVAACALACGEGPPVRASAIPPEADPCRAAPIALRIEPAESEILAGTARRSEVAYRTIAIFADQSQAVVSAAWEIDAPKIGTIDDGRFIASGEAGGRVRLTARAEGLTANAELLVRLTWRHFDEGVPPEVEARFARDKTRATDRARPAFTFPPPEYAFPSDPEEIDIQWDGAGHPWFRLVLSGPDAEISVYTQATHFQPPVELWHRIGESNRGRSVQLSLEAADEDGVVVPAAAGVPALFCVDDEVCNGFDDDCNGGLDDHCVTPRGVFACGECDRTCR